MKVTIEEFRRWEKDPVTQEIYKYLTTCIEDLNNQLCDGYNIINQPNILIKLFGEREGLNRILNLSITDIGDNDEETKDHES